MAQLAGKSFQFSVAGTLFSAADYHVVDADTGATVDNSKLGGYGGSIPTTANLLLTVTQPSLDPAENPFAGAVQIKTQQYVADVVLWCDGTGDTVNRWWMPIALVVSTEMSGRAGAGSAQPVAWTFKNFGTFYRPGEAP